MRAHDRFHEAADSLRPFGGKTLAGIRHPCVKRQPDSFVTVANLVP